MNYTCGIAIVDKNALMKNNILRVIHFKGFEKSPSKEDADAFKTEIDSDPEFKKHFKDVEYTMITTIGLLVDCFNIVEATAMNQLQEQMEAEKDKPQAGLVIPK